LAPYLRDGLNAICAEVALQPAVGADFSMGHGGFLLEAEAICHGGARLRIATGEGWKAVLDEGHLSPDAYDARKGRGDDWQRPGYDDGPWPPAQALDGALAALWPLQPSRIPGLMTAAVRPERAIVPFAEFKRRILNAKALLQPASAGAAATVATAAAAPATAATATAVATATATATTTAAAVIVTAATAATATTAATAAAVVTAGSPVTFWLRFGREVAGYASFTLEGSANAQMWLDFEEIAGKSHSRFAYTLREGRQSFQAMGLKGFQYLRVTLAGLSAPVKLLDVHCVFSSYPVAYEGLFRCSNKTLNRIWDACRWTAQLCMQDYFLDSPVHQEPSACPGDYMIESLINYYAFGDAHLPRQDILKVMRNIRQGKGAIFHTSYSLLWVQMLMDYRLYTGDDSLVREAADTVFMLLERFEGYRGEEGLVSLAPNYMFMDWVEAAGANLHHPPRSMGMGYMTAFYYKALLNGAQAAELVGREELARTYRGRAEAAREAFNRLLWSDEKGLYRDGLALDPPVAPSQWLPGDPEGETYSQHTNSLAVLYGLAPAGRQQALMERVLRDGALIRCQPYFMHFLLEATAHSGLFGACGLDQILRWQGLLEEHASSLKEIWGDGGFDCDYSHAWSGTPGYQLPSKVLGVAPEAPGFARIAIRPMLGALQWASGRVPTPLGIVAVAWRRRQDALELRVEIPQGATARLFLPRSDPPAAAVFSRKTALWRREEAGARPDPLPEAGPESAEPEATPEAGAGPDAPVLCLRPGKHHLRILPRVPRMR
jgi:hypothetical protein